MESAIRLQLDSLHPYGDDEVAWGWSPAGRGAALVGIARSAVVDRYVQSVCRGRHTGLVLHVSRRPFCTPPSA